MSLRPAPARAIAALVLLAAVVLALAAPLIFPAGPLARMAEPLLAPGPAAWLGSDDLGRSLAAQLLYGWRTSLVVAAGVLAMSLSLGLAAGLAAGLRGGWVDELATRVTELFQVLPRTFLAIVAVAFFGASIDVLILVLGLSSWATIARVVRAATRAAAAADFVVALRGLGASDVWIARHHLLRYGAAPVMAAAGSVVAATILAEAALGFVGLGDAQAASLGSQLAQAYAFTAIAPWMGVVPGLAILSLVLAVHFLFEPVGPSSADPGAIELSAALAPDSGSQPSRRRWLDRLARPPTPAAGSSRA